MNVDTKTIHTVDYGEMNASVQKFLKKHGLAPKTKGEGFDVVAAEELGNDSEKAFTVEAELPDNYDMQLFKKWDYSFRTGTLLNWMCHDGEIPAGEYMVEICW